MPTYPVAVDDLVVIRVPEGCVIAQVTSTSTAEILYPGGEAHVLTISLQVAWDDTVMDTPPRIAAIAQKAALFPEAGKLIGHLYPDSEHAIRDLKQYIRPGVGVATKG